MGVTVELQRGVWVRYEVVAKRPLSVRTLAASALHH
jgi:hypothetical protein